MNTPSSTIVMEGKLRRDAGIIGLLFASTTSIVGSGWLFGAYHASRIAGPWSLVTWILGAIIILLIALCFSELAALFPKSGALVHMSHASHGDSLGRIWVWLLFLAYAPIPSVESEAIVTYANNYLPYFLQPGNSGLLTGVGFITCAALLGVMALLNLMMIRWLMNVNSTITWWKLFVPVVTVIALIGVSKPWGVMHAAPGTFKMEGIFTALPAAGVVFSYLGFRTAIDLGGESRNPQRNIPLAVIGSVLLSGVLYILLQYAFLMALAPQDLANGWANLTFKGEMGPFAGLAATLGLGWMATLLYIDAYVSPGGTGLIYMTGGSRILFAAAELKAGPASFARLNGNQIPWVSVLAMWVVGVIFLAPFPAWQQMVGFITSITVLTFGLGPVALLVLRRNLPDMKRPFHLRGGALIATVAFIASNLVVYWTGFRTNNFLFLMAAIGFALYALHYHFVARHPASEFGWKHIWWLLPWFGGLWILSYLGNIGGGRNVIPFGWDILIVSVWSLIVLWLAMRCALDKQQTEATMESMLKTN